MNLAMSSMTAAISVITAVANSIQAWRIASPGTKKPAQASARRAQKSRLMVGLRMFGMRKPHPMGEYWGLFSFLSMRHPGSEAVAVLFCPSLFYFRDVRLTQCVDQAGIATSQIQLQPRQQITLAVEALALVLQGGANGNSRDTFAPNVQGEGDRARREQVLPWRIDGPESLRRLQVMPQIRHRCSSTKDIRGIGTAMPVVTVGAYQLPTMRSTHG
jgi:hypothetical protein